MSESLVPADEACSNPGVDIALSIVTCGIYNLFWQARQFRALNGMLGEDKFQFGMWLLLTIVTCGIYHIITQYQMGQALVDIQRRRGQPVSDSLPVLSAVLSVLGLAFVVDALQQVEINRLYGR